MYNIYKYIYNMYKYIHNMYNFQIAFNFQINCYCKRLRYSIPLF